jgi:hypothetical protein
VYSYIDVQLASNVDVWYHMHISVKCRRIVYRDEILMWYVNDVVGDNC